MHLFVISKKGLNNYKEGKKNMKNGSAGKHLPTRLTLNRKTEKGRGNAA
jgi:hypothetical protein